MSGSRNSGNLFTFPRSFQAATYIKYFFSPAKSNSVSLSNKFKGFMIWRRNHLTDRSPEYKAITCLFYQTLSQAHLIPLSSWGFTTCRKDNFIFTISALGLAFNDEHGPRTSLRIAFILLRYDQKVLKRIFSDSKE